ncbi:MAG TPA: hypothetical protein VKE69_06050, partial [Planctomycetota bacterium]|nr:hypothetical protein [Planctomycetota bacterium]
MNRRKRQRSREGGSILVLSLVILFVVAGFTAALLTIATSSRATAQVNEKKLTARGLAEGAVENGKQWLQTNWANQQGSAISTLSKSTPLDLENPAAWSHVTIDGNDARWALMSVIPTLSPAPNAGSHANMTTDGEGWWVDGADGVRTMHYLYAVQGRAEFTPKQNAGDSKSIVGAMSRVVEAQL